VEHARHRLRGLLACLLLPPGRRGPHTRGTALVRLGKWLHVDVFWLEEDIRRQGWGTKMLEAAHQIGREKGAEAAWLDTFS